MREVVSSNPSAADRILDGLESNLDGGSPIKPLTTSTVPTAILIPPAVYFSFNT